MVGRPLSSPALLLAMASLQAVAAAPPIETTHVLELRDGWTYGPAAAPPALDRLPEAWQHVALPHRQGTESCGFYRLSFPVPMAWVRQRVVLVLRSPVGSVWAWLNGEAVGVRPPTALDTRLDVTHAVRAGAINTLLVAVSAPESLEREGLVACWLEAVGAVGVERLASSAWRLNQGAVVDVGLEVRNRTLERFEGRLELALEPVVQPRGRHIVWRRHNDIRLDPGRSAPISHSFEIERPRFWRFDDPCLYRLTATVRTRERKVVHTAVRRLGLRSIEVVNGRWHAGGEWVRIAGIAVRARGATLLCTQSAQALAALERLVPGREAPLPELLDLCDEQGIVVLLDAPAHTDDVAGWREALGDLARVGASHPCVWGWVVSGQDEAYPAALAHLRELTPRLPAGRPAPELAVDARDFDFVVSRFDTHAVRHDNDRYGRRLDDLRRDAGGKAIVVIDRLAPAQPGDGASVARSLRRRRGEASRRASTAMLCFELERDEQILRVAESGLRPFSLRPPRHEARVDKKTFVVKTRFEATIASPVVGRMPCHSLVGYRLVWGARGGDGPVASGSVPLKSLVPRTIEGHSPGSARGEAEWRVPKPGKLDFTVELQSAAGHVVARHRNTLSLRERPKGRAELRVGPPTKVEPTEPPRTRPLVSPEAVVMLDIAKLFNNDGISSQANKKDGNFDLPKLASGDTYPADQLPPSSAELPLPAMPALRFHFPDKADGKANNVRCAGQRLEVRPHTYSTLWLLASADTRDQEDGLRLVYERGEEPVTLRVTDWCSEAKFGEIEAIRCSARHTWDGKREERACRIWAIALSIRRDPLRAIVLPANERIHIFAATLVRATQTESIHVGALARHFNNDGISWRANPRDGNFDLSGRRSGDSFIADLLPKSGALVALPGNEAVTFRFPSKDDRRRNNVVCDGQRIVLPEPYRAYDAAWFLGACHNGSKTALLTVEYEDREEHGELRLADWCAKPTAGEIEVIRLPARHVLDSKDEVGSREEKVECALVAWRVRLDPRRKLVAIRVPRERTMHVFALTLSRTQAVTEAKTQN